MNHLRYLFLLLSKNKLVKIFPNLILKFFIYVNKYILSDFFGNIIYIEIIFWD